jgi:hypothetical protein
MSSLAQTLVGLVGAETVMAQAIKGIYRTDTPCIPDGYEVIGFRIPVLGETYLGRHLGQSVYTAGNPDTFDQPRLIVKRLPPVMVKVVKFVPVVEGGKQAYRPLKHGDYWADVYQGFSQWTGIGCLSQKSYPIYRRVEEEVPVTSLT